MTKRKRKRHNNQVRSCARNYIFGQLLCAAVNIRNARKRVDIISAEDILALLDISRKLSPILNNWDNHYISKRYPKELDEANSESK